MQTESSPGYTPDRSGSRCEDKQLKVILNIVINKCKKRNSGANSSVVKMSDLRENDSFCEMNESKKSLGTTISIKEMSTINTAETAVINPEPLRNQDEDTTEKQKVKTIKVKITISEEDNEECDGTQKETVGDTITSNNKKSANRKVSVMEECEGNSTSLILKTPEKEEKFEYETLNEKGTARGNELIFEETVHDDKIRFTPLQELELFHLLANEQTLDNTGTNIIAETSNSSGKPEELNSYLTDEQRPISNYAELDNIVYTSGRFTLMNSTENEQKTERSKPLKSTDENCAILYASLNIPDGVIKDSTENKQKSEKPETAKSLLTEQKPTLSIENYSNLNATLNTSLGPAVDDSTENEEKAVDYGEKNHPESFYIPSFPQFSTPKKPSKNPYFYDQVYTTKLNQTDSMFVQQIDYNELSNNRDSLIIHDIIMEHYYEVLNNFNKKSMKRKLYRRSVSLLDNKEAMDLEMEPIQPFFNTFHHTEREVTFQSNGKSFDSGLHEMIYGKSIDTLECSHEAGQKCDYDESAFLRDALGEELMNMTDGSEARLEIISIPSPISECPQIYGTQRSIGSSEISALVSGYDKSAIYSLYSTVNKTTKKKPSALKKTSTVRPVFGTTSSNNSDGFYESIDTYRSSKVDKLIKDIYVQSVIANQVAKALSFCKNKPKLLGTVNHLEAEKILLHTSYKMQILHNELEKNEYEEMGKGQSHGTIKIQNLKFSSKANNNTEKSKDFIQYYVCLVHSGATVLASDVTLSEKNGNVTFKNCFDFTFNSLLSEIEINVGFYCLNIRNNRNRKTLCFSPNKIYSARKFEKEEGNNNEAYPKTSGVQLLGRSKIGVLELSRRDHFKLQNIPLHATISDTFTAEIQIGLNIDNKSSGFLTIGTGNTLWNRRWCTLDGFYIKYWNYPSHENDETPIGIIDLHYCITREVLRADKSICSRPRTFVIETKIKEEDAAPKLYFLSADNLSEFKEWKMQINAVLMLLRSWKNLKCQTVLLDN